MHNYSITSTVTTITPELARDILQGNTMNRPLNAATVADYAAQMEKGLWRLNGEPIIISTTGGLLDGQHRLEAVCASGATIKSVIIYNVDPDSFSTIDTGRLRTMGDMLAIEGVSNSSQKAAAIMAYFKLTRNHGDTGITYQSVLGHRSARTLKISKKEMLDFYSKNMSLVDNAVTIACRCVGKYRLIRNSAIAGYIIYLVTVKNHPIDKVEDFFLQLHQLNPETNKSISVLRTALLRNITKQHILTNKTCHAYITKVWNAFVTGREMQVLVYNEQREGAIEFV